MQEHIRINNNIAMCAYERVIVAETDGSPIYYGGTVTSSLTTFNFFLRLNLDGNIVGPRVLRVQNENGIKLYERDNFPVHEDIVITAPFSAGNHKANIGFADPAAPAGFNSLFKFNVIVGGMPPLPPIIPPIS